MAGIVPRRAPIFPCQAASRSKVWNSVRSAQRSNVFQSCSTTSRSPYTWTLTPDLEVGCPSLEPAARIGAGTDQGRAGTSVAGTSSPSACLSSATPLPPSRRSSGRAVTPVRAIALAPMMLSGLSRTHACNHFLNEPWRSSSPRSADARGDRIGADVTPIPSSFVKPGRKDGRPGTETRAYGL